MTAHVFSRGHDRVGLTVVVAIGALWGITEATLGFLLHLASRLAPGVGLAGFVMFPIAVGFMLASVRLTGWTVAPLAAAIVAAAVKLSSAALPAVGLLFVTNPALAIVAEGAVVSLLGRALVPSRPMRLAVSALGTSLLWRALFLMAVYLLPVQKGILMKGPAALASFVGLEAAVNAAIITAAGLLAGRGYARPADARAAVGEGTNTESRPPSGAPARASLLGRPSIAGALVAAAVGVEMVYSVL